MAKGFFLLAACDGSRDKQRGGLMKQQIKLFLFETWLGEQVLWFVERVFGLVIEPAGTYA